MRKAVFCLFLILSSCSSASEKQPAPELQCQEASERLGELACVHRIPDESTFQSVAVALERPPGARQPFWHLVGAIAVSADAAPVPPDLEAPYRAAVAAARDAAPASLRRGLDRTEAASLLAAIAGLSGEAAIAEAIEGIIDADLSWECPVCKDWIAIAVAELPFRAVSDDGATTTADRSTTPRPALATLVDLATGVAQHGLAAQLAALECVVTCPVCAAASPLLG